MADNEPKSPIVAGIHVAGPNSGKTAMVVLSGNALDGSLHIKATYGRIGNYGKHLSDERLIELLRCHHPAAHVVVDVPLTVPPCVACVRPVCPGVASCEDVSVNYMLALAERKLPRRQRRSRPVNPQSQRLWDLLHSTRHPDDLTEPTYNSNVAPLAIRARTFERRLNHVFPNLSLSETNVGLALQGLATQLELPSEWARDYRSFEHGRSTRNLWVDTLQDQGWIDDSDPELDAVADSVELFQAFVAAMIGALQVSGLVASMPVDYDIQLGWVHTPQLAVDCTKG